MSNKPTLRPFRTSPRLYGPTQGGFRNVDLDIAATFDLSPLMRALDPRLCILHFTTDARRSFITAELNRQPKSAEIAIPGLTEVLATLRGRPLALWRRCTRRSLNVGYDACATFPALSDVISSEAIIAMKRVGVDLAITIYPPDPERPPPRKAPSRRSRPN